MSEKRNIPNPHGRKGGKAHQDLIKKIEKEIDDQDLFSDTENEVIINSNKKRFADIAAIDISGDVIEYHQIGKQNKDGSPVARERRAIDEIEKATGKKVWFHAYNVVIAVILLVGLVLAVSAA